MTVHYSIDVALAADSFGLIVLPPAWFDSPIEQRQPMGEQIVADLCHRLERDDAAVKVFFERYCCLIPVAARSATMWSLVTPGRQPIAPTDGMTIFRKPPPVPKAEPSAAVTPHWRQRINPDKLLPAEFQYNNSLIRFDGRLLMAYRLHWQNSYICLAELDEQFQPIGNWRLPLKMGTAQEDPRLWVHRGQLHVSYSAVTNRGGAIATDVCYARLARNAAGQWIVEGEHAPHYSGRDHWEKNWGFFEHAGELYAVYWISPHRILRIDGDRAELVAELPCDFGNGAIHGGAPPALFQGEYYNWFHRRLGKHPDATYAIELYTFEAKPPFRPSRRIMAPLLNPHHADRPWPKAPHAVFPAGAFIDDRNCWCVSFGYYDKWSELVGWNVNHIEAALEPLTGGPFDGLSLRDDDGSRFVWKQVYLGNEYRLPPSMDGQIVVDIGAHVGSFSRACLDRGAALVINCEPDDQSLTHLRENLSAFGERSRIVAAYASADATSDLPSQYRDSMTPVASAGRVSLADLFAGLPYVDWLKLDCEGPEHEMVASVDLSRVRHIVGEVHRRGNMGIESFVADLERQGFRVEWEALGGSDWLWNFWAART